MFANLSSISNTSASTSSWYEENLLLIKSFRYWMVLLCFGAILVVGVFGNLYAWAVMVYSSRNDSSTTSSVSTSYSSCISCKNTNPSTFIIELILLLDAFTVAAGAVNHFGSAFGFSLRNSSTPACVSHYFVDHFARDCSLWREGLFSVMRLVAVTWPHKLRVLIISIFSNLTV